MTQEKFTPGPWKIINGDLSNHRVHQVVGPFVFKRKVNLPDINLISQAPNLYHALKNLREAQKEYLADRGNEELGQKVGKAAEYADEILSKTIGEK